MSTCTNTEGLQAKQDHWADLHSYSDDTEGLQAKQDYWADFHSYSDVLELEKRLEQIRPSV
jgi:hypothetical protein